MLNVFAYTCAFSLCAAAAGARATSLDLSRRYLDWGRANFEANGIDPAPHDWIFGDAFDWLRRLAKKGRAFDVVVLDPPTFSTAKGESSGPHDATGLFTTFITNQPDTVQETIYRQADNVFIFNFTNEHDIETIGKVAKSDSETIRSLIRGTPARRCLLLGNVVHDLPLMVDIEALDVRTMGETRLFFS